jgi:hypothetical protein
MSKKKKNRGVKNTIWMFGLMLGLIITIAQAKSDGLGLGLDAPSAIQQTAASQPTQPQSAPKAPVASPTAVAKTTIPTKTAPKSYVFMVIQGHEPKFMPLDEKTKYRVDWKGPAGVDFQTRSRYGGKWSKWQTAHGNNYVFPAERHVDAFRFKTSDGVVWTQVTFTPDVEA